MKELKRSLSAIGADGGRRMCLGLGAAGEALRLAKEGSRKAVVLVTDGQIGDYRHVAFEVMAVSPGSSTFVVTKRQASELTTEFWAKFKKHLVSARIRERIV